MEQHRLRVAFGPAAPEFGSWRWLGSDLCDALAQRFDTTVFENTVPACDVAIFIKFKPSAVELRSLRNRAALVFCPVDVYGNPTEIEVDGSSLSCFDLIVAHARRLERYFSAFSPVHYLDHPLKYVVPPSECRVTSGPILWIGNRSNLPPVVEWVNRRDLPEELWVLTDLETNSRFSTSDGLGFTARNRVRVENWSCERHLAWLKLARAAFDIKGLDFRSRHKSTAKAFDYIASGLPLAMNQTSSAVEVLRAMGFGLASPEDVGHWLSNEYWEATQEVGKQLRRDFALPCVAQRLGNLVQSAWASSLMRREPLTV
ncbi:MAG: hypothetical protein JWM11_2924 [Planctomycetaceae bacterium]|nr:hypothetical protein [Planctomycetaceae bacterium]